MADDLEIVVKATTDISEAEKKVQDFINKYSKKPLPIQFDASSIEKALKKLDFSTVGDKLAQQLEASFNRIDFSKINFTASFDLSTITKSFDDLIDKINITRDSFEGLGKALSTGNGIDLSNLAKAVAQIGNVSNTQTVTNMQNVANAAQNASQAVTNLGNATKAAGSVKIDASGIQSIEGYGKYIEAARASIDRLGDAFSDANAKLTSVSLVQPFSGDTVNAIVTFKNALGQTTQMLIPFKKEMDETGEVVISIDKPIEDIGNSVLKMSENFAEVERNAARLEQTLSNAGRSISAMWDKIAIKGGTLSEGRANSAIDILTKLDEQQQALNGKRLAGEFINDSELTAFLDKIKAAQTAINNLFAAQGRENTVRKQFDDAEASISKLQAKFAEAGDSLSRDRIEQLTAALDTLKQKQQEMSEIGFTATDEQLREYQRTIAQTRQIFDDAFKGQSIDNSAYKSLFDDLEQRSQAMLRVRDELFKAQQKFDELDSISAKGETSLNESRVQQYVTAMQALADKMHEIESLSFNATKEQLQELSHTVQDTVQKVNQLYSEQKYDDKIAAQTQKQIEANEKAVASWNATIAKVKASYFEGEQPLQGEYKTKLETAISEAEDGIKKYADAGAKATNQMKLEVDGLVKSLQLLAKTQHETQYSKTNNAKTGVETTKAIYTNQLDRLEQRMSTLGVTTGDFYDRLQNLKAALNSLGESSGASNELRDSIQKLRNEFDVFERSAEGAALSVKQNLLNALSEKTLPTLDQWLSTPRLMNAETTGLTELRDQITWIKQAYEETQEVLKGTSDPKVIQEAQAHIEALNAKYKELGVTMKTVQSDSKWDLKSEDLNKIGADLDNLKAKYEDIIAKSPELQQAIADFTAKLENANPTQVEALRKRLATLNAELRTSSNEAGNFGQIFRQSFGSVGNIIMMYASSMRIFMKAIQSIKQMITNVRELDTSLVELQKVTSLSGKELENFTNNAFEMGQKLGRTGKDVTDAVTTFSRAGYDLQDAMDLSEAALVMTNIGADINDTATAASHMISILKAYDVDATDAMSVIDTLYNVSNLEPIDFGNITQGLVTVGGTLAQTGTDIKQSIAMITGGFTTMRDVGKVSNGLIMISQRLRGVNEDGEAIDGLAPKLKELFGTVGISLENENGELRSTYDILNDLASVWDQISSKQQQLFGEKVAGNRQVKILNALMQNWDVVQKSMGDAMSADGTAMQGNELFAQSIEGRINKLKSAVQDLSRTTIDSGFVKFWVDAARGVVELTTKIGGLQRVIIPLAAIWTSIKIGETGKALKVAGAGIGSLSKSLFNFKTATPYVIALTAAIIAMQEATKYQQKLEDAASSAKSKYNERLSKVDDLNSELEETRSLMADLEGRSLTPIEQDEYNRLQATTEELQRQLDIEKELAEIERGNYAGAANKAVGSRLNAANKYGGYTVPNVIMDTIDDVWDAINGKESKEYKPKQWIHTMLNTAAQRGDTGAAAWNDWLNAATYYETNIRGSEAHLSYGDYVMQYEKVLPYLLREMNKAEQNKDIDLLTILQRNYDEAQNVILEFADYIFEQFGEELFVAEDGKELTSAEIKANEFISRAQRDRAMLLRDKKNQWGYARSQQLDQFNALIDSIDTQLASVEIDWTFLFSNFPDFINILREYGWTDQQIQAQLYSIASDAASGILDSSASAVSALLGKYSELSEELYSTTSAYEALSKAISEQESSGRISAATMAALIAQDAEYGNYLEAIAGGYRLNTDLLYDYIEAQDKFEQGKAINRILEIQDALANMKLTDMERLDLTNEMHQLEMYVQEIDDATGAWSRLQAAKKSANADANYQTQGNLYKEFKEMRESGKVGTDDFDAYIAYALGEDWETAYSGDWQKAAKDAQAKFKRYATGEEKDDWNNFFDDLVKTGLMNKAGEIAEGTTIQDIAEAMGISEDFAETMINLGSTYTRDFKLPDSMTVTESGKDLAEQAKELEDLQSKLEEYQKTLERLQSIRDEGNDTGKYGEYGSLDAITEEIEKTKAQIEGTQALIDAHPLSPDTTAAQDALEKAVTLIRSIYEKNGEEIIIPFEPSGKYEELIALLEILDKKHTLSVNVEEDNGTNGGTHDTTYDLPELEPGPLRYETTIEATPKGKGAAVEKAKEASESFAETVISSAVDTVSDAGTVVANGTGVSAKGAAAGAKTGITEATSNIASAVTSTATNAVTGAVTSQSGNIAQGITQHAQSTASEATGKVAGAIIDAASGAVANNISQGSFVSGITGDIDVSPGKGITSDTQSDIENATSDIAETMTKTATNAVESAVETQKGDITQGVAQHTQDTSSEAAESVADMIIDAASTSLIDKSESGEIATGFTGDIDTSPAGSNAFNDGVKDVAQAGLDSAGQILKDVAEGVEPVTAAEVDTTEQDNAIEEVNQKQEEVSSAIQQAKDIYDAGVQLATNGILISAQDTVDQWIQAAEYLASAGEELEIADYQALQEYFKSLFPDNTPDVVKQTEDLEKEWEEAKDEYIAQAKERYKEGFTSNEELPEVTDEVNHAVEELPEAIDEVKTSVDELPEVVDEVKQSLDELPEVVDEAKQEPNPFDTYTTKDYDKEYFDSLFEEDKTLADAEFSVIKAATDYFGELMTQTKAGLESLEAARQVMENYFSQGGNVDLNNRPVIPTEKLIDMGFDAEPGNTATVYSSTYRIGENGEYGIVFTPILPDGDVLEANEVENYIDGLHIGENGQIEGDELGLVISTLDLSGMDESQRDEFLAQFGEYLHQVQEYLYGDTPTVEPEIEPAETEFDWGTAFEEAREAAEEEPVEMNVEANPETVIESTQEAFDDSPPVTFDAEVEQPEVAEDVTTDVKFDVDSDPIEKVERLISEMFTEVNRLNISPDDASMSLVKEMESSADDLVSAMQKVNSMSPDDAGYDAASSDLESAASNFTNAYNNLARALYIPKSVDVYANTSPASNAIDRLSDKTVTVTVVTREVTEQYARGTHNAKGGLSLVDEAGAELIEHTSTGTYELGTNKGARLVNLQPGDVVHTASETKGILRRAADFIGGAFKAGTPKLSSGVRAVAYEEEKKLTSSLTGTKLSKAGSSKSKKKSSSSKKKSSSSKKKSSSKKSSSNSGDLKDYVDSLFDWIEVRLDRLDRQTETWKDNAAAAIGYIARNSYLDKAIASTQEQIEAANAAYTRYIKQADTIASKFKLSADLYNKIKNGTIDISQYDEDTREKISAVKEWYDKALDARDSIADLQESITQLAAEKLDNVLDTYQYRINRLEAVADLTASKLDLKRTVGKEIFEKEYEDAITSTTDKVREFVAEHQTLQDEFASVVTAGYIKEGSEEWDKYTSELEDLQKQIIDTQKDLQELVDEAANLPVEKLQYALETLKNLQDIREDWMGLHEAQSIDNTGFDYEYLIQNGMEQIQNLKEQNELLRQQQSGLDVLSEKYQELEKDIRSNESAIMDMMTQQEKWNDAALDLEISKIEDYRDNLNKINDAYQKQKELQDAIQELEKARRQRTNRIYREGVGFVYEADQEAIQKAQENLDQVLHDQTMDKIDEIIDAIEDLKADSNVYDAEGNLLGQRYTLPEIGSYEDLLESYSASTILNDAVKEAKKAAYEQVMSGVTNNASNTIQIGDIVVNGVENVQALVDAIQEEFPAALLQAIHGK